MIPCHRTFDAMSGMFGWMFRTAQIESIEGMSFLEIGTGQYINHPVCAYICGASKVVTYDIKDNRVENYKQSFDNIVMANRFLNDLVKPIVFKSRIRCIDRYIEQVEFTTTRPKKHFNIIFSYSTLEHIFDEDIFSLLEYVESHSDISLHYIDIEDPKRACDRSVYGWQFLFNRIFKKANYGPASDGSWLIVKTGK